MGTSARESLIQQRSRKAPLMPRWESGWREHALRHAGIDVTQFAVDMMQYWMESTPTQPWTNNPLGFPQRGYSTARAMKSPYAAFPTMNHFHDSFKKLLSSKAQHLLRFSLSGGENPAEVWRAVNSLKWPANGTETDYPSRVLDRVDSGYREKLQSRPPEQRSSIGLDSVSPGTHHDSARQLTALHHAATRFDNINDALRHIQRTMSNNG